MIYKLVPRITLQARLDYCKTYHTLLNNIVCPQMERVAQRTKHILAGY